MNIYVVIVLLLFSLPYFWCVYKSTTCTRDGLVKIYLIKQMILSNKGYVLLYLALVMFIFLYFKFYSSVFFLVLPLLPIANRLERLICIFLLFILIYLNMPVLSVLASFCFLLYLLVIIKLNPIQYINWYSR